MDTAITVIQVVLALAFTIGGLAKIALPYAQYSSISLVAWSKEFKPEHLRLMGILEVCAGVGLIVPLFLPSLQMLMPLAALGIALYMAGAMATHLRRSEYALMVANLVVFLVPALLVAYSRLMEIAL